MRKPHASKWRSGEATLAQLSFKHKTVSLKPLNVFRVCDCRVCAHRRHEVRQQVSGSRSALTGAASGRVGGQAWPSQTLRHEAAAPRCAGGRRGSTWARPHAATCPALSHGFSVLALGRNAQRGLHSEGGPSALRHGPLGVTLFANTVQGASGGGAVRGRQGGPGPVWPASS